MPDKVSSFAMRMRDQCIIKSQGISLFGEGSRLDVWMIGMMNVT